MDTSSRLSLPFISPGQAQKELFHNEALQTLDILVSASVEEPPRADPPAAAVVGTCFIVGEQPTGIWAEHAGKIAAYTSGGWRYLSPVDGLSVYIKSTDSLAARRSGTWRIVGGIPDPTGGTVIDAEGRAAIGAILSALRQHGLTGV